MNIYLRNISKSFGSQTILQDLTCELFSGEFITLLGPSGCGKTTLLRILAGLEVADSGVVRFDGEDVAKWSLQERRVGFVFQHYALFPHMTVAENISFGLRMRPRGERHPKPVIAQRVAELLSLVRLEGLERRYPHQLSGGQKQRVALARSLAIEPRVLLLDEPFGALDAHVREDLRQDLRELQRSLGMTCILVTHDQEEALALSDRILLLEKGTLAQYGTPDELYQRPESAYVMRYLGAVNQIGGELAPRPLTRDIFVRAHDIRLFETGVARLGGRLSRIVVQGSLIRADLEAVWKERKYLLKVEIPRERWQRAPYRQGELVSWDFSDYIQFESTSDRTRS